MGKITHYEATGHRISINQFEYLAKNPKYKFDGTKVTMLSGTLIAYRHESVDSESERVYKEGRY